MDFALPLSLGLVGFGPQGWGRPLLAAAGMTVAVSTSGFAFGCAFGGVLACAKLSGVRVLKAGADVYTTVIRSVPELLILYLLFFGGSAFLTALSSVFLGEGFMSAPAFLTGVFALGLISASYIAEVLRGAWQGVDPGQIDAAASLGMRWTVGLRKVLLPQVIRLALPGLGNVWQLTLKESALISLTGLTELMRQAAVAANATSKPFFFYSAAAILYLAISTVSAILFRQAERRSRRGYRRG